MSNGSVTTSEIEFTADEYNFVVDTAKLRIIQVLKVGFDVDVNYYNTDAKKNYDVTREEVGATFDPVAGAILGRFRFTVSVRRQRRKVLKGVAEYIVLYDVDKAAAERAAVAFCNRVGMFAAYPYFRALLSHLSWESNAKLPVLPVIASGGARISKRKSASAPRPKPKASTSRHADR